ncbi:MAG: 2-oxo acid dehydrogenase subunit E2 [Spirochaetota bacterium]|nr:MAG: 2-oxo acid dehydrogenase subunit E2 [Spirochaetota bacterium]
MAEEVVMLALSPTMESGTIVKWHKKEGDSIETGQILCEVETDKATMEYESVNEGTLLKIMVKEGEEASVGQTIAIAGEEGEDISAFADKSAEQPADLSAEEPVEVAEVKEEISEEKKEETVSVGEKLPKGVKASPLARKLALEKSVDLKAVTGSGPGGRIIRKDIETARAKPEGFVTVPEGTTKAVSVGTATVSAGIVRVQAQKTEDEEIPVSQKRRVIAQRLSESKFTAPHYYLTTVVAVDDLVMARKQLNKKREDKISLNAFLIKLTAEALRRNPMVNSSFRGDTIIKFGRADIALAVAQPDGLITPVVRDCWNRGIIDIDEELKSLIEKALSNKLKPVEYSDSTFTISNLGSFGIHEFTAIVNPPNSAILAVGEIKREPVADEDDTVVFKSNMHITLSCDHRVVDGAIGARFLKDLKEFMESPIKALY